MKNLWDERYSQAAYLYGKEPNDFLVEATSSMPPGRVLCLAEGQGRNAVYLAGRGYQVTGVDSSAVGLAKAQQLASARGVKITTIVADLSEFTIQPNSWEAIVSIFCHLPPALRADIHRQVVAGLRPGGVLVLEAYTPRQLAFNTGGPPTADLMMDLPTLRQELQGLDFLFAAELERDIHEGDYHHGRSAVVQAIARKPSA
jgi:SAM-dependent methyltransferase